MKTKFLFHARMAISMIITGMLVLVSCSTKETAEPIASFTINTHVAFANRVVTVDASPSRDPDGEALSLQVRWDFDDDGTWDTEYSFDKQFNWSFVTSGYHPIRLEVKDQDNLTSEARDSIKIFGPFPDSVMVDPRDGQQYRIVQINGMWIMAENLRYGTQISSLVKQTDNHVVEYYVYDNDPANLPRYGGLYSQEEAMNYNMHTYNRGICPNGWRIPDKADWELIDIKVAHYFVSEYYGPKGISGLNLQFGGYFITKTEKNDPLGPRFWGMELYGCYWNTYYLKESDGLRRQGSAGLLNRFDDYTKNWTGLLLYGTGDLSDYPADPPVIVRDWYHSVRCVK